MVDFNPNEPCGDNGNYFGFPYKWEDCPLVLVSVPWDVTTSYRAGASRGPEAIRRASVQLDFFDFEIPRAWALGIGTYPFNETVARRSRAYRKIAEKQIAFSEGGVSEKEYPLSARTKDCKRIEKACEETHLWLENTAAGLLAEHHLVGVVGGDHSSPLGLLRALAKKHKSFGILHFDAHDDLREAYEGFRYSHASIMYNALQIPSVKKLVQVGVRDVCQQEQEGVKAQGGKVVQFPDIILKKRLFEGGTWRDICRDILAALPRKVYVSFDIDVLQPQLCPHTGTPVPGGPDFSQVQYLLSRLRESGKEIIGFDLCEVAPAPTLKGQQPDEWDGNVGARILYLLSNTLLAARK